MVPGERLSPADAAVLETFVVPRYLSLYGELMLEMLLVADQARIAHLGCRTGYPDRQMHELGDGASIVGIQRPDASIVNPGPEDEIRAGDKVLLLGRWEQLTKARAALVNGA